MLLSLRLRSCLLFRPQRKSCVDAVAHFTILRKECAFIVGRSEIRRKHYSRWIQEPRLCFAKKQAGILAQALGGQMQCVVITWSREIGSGFQSKVFLLIVPITPI
jgi:hypothetical protein